MTHAAIEFMKSRKPEILSENRAKQFSIAQLLILTFIASVICGLARFFIGSRAMLILLLAYCVPLFIWAVIRGPHIARELKRLRQRRILAKVTVEEALKNQRLKPRMQDTIKAEET